MTVPVVRLPRRLRAGDTVAVVSLSSAAAHDFPERFDAGIRQLEAALDVHVRVMPHARASAAELERSPELRVADLHAALADTNVHGIVSSIGGEDSIRLLPLLDLDLVAANPKPFIGFSDTTVTHMAFLAAGVGSFYGPAVMAGFAENAGMHEYTANGVRTMLMGEGPPGAWPPNEGGWTVERLDWADPANQQQRRALRPTTGWRWLQGDVAVEGRCVAGCLEVLDWLRGTPAWPDLDGAVLAIETSEEAPSPAAVARILRAVAAASGGFRGLRALLLGRPGGSELDPDGHAAYDDVVLAVLRDELGLDRLPIVAGMDFGHTDPLWTLPIGARTIVDPARRTVSFPDPVTTPDR